MDFLKDNDFLVALNNYSNKKFWVKIEVLDSTEAPISSIEGRVQPGSSINISGSSSVRRTCNINFMAEEGQNDLTNIENLLSANKKIRIFEGIKNEINTNYDDVVWFPLGIFVIVQPSISHNNGGCIVSLSCKDKMCLLNGECAGGLPTSVIFDYYDQIIGLQEVSTDPRTDDDLEPNNYTIYKLGSGDSATFYMWSRTDGWETITATQADKLKGSTVEVRQLIYDIIQTLVCYYGGESLSKIFINDVPKKIKQIVRYTGSSPLYFNSKTAYYTINADVVAQYAGESGDWTTFNTGEDCGYVYTDFVYPSKKHGLTSSIGDNVCTILDKIKNALGNYEYFYDVEGNFVFQEIKNYLNNSYDPVDKYRLDNGRRVEIESNRLDIIDDLNYKVDFHSNSKSVYTFNEDTGLITSFTNNPNYTNLKNDFHIWGENNDGYAIHYHLVIKEKPVPVGYDEKGQPYYNTYSVVFYQDERGEYTGKLRLANEGETGIPYTARDWRAELYLQGLTAKARYQRPDIYQQELLDLFDDIYDFSKTVQVDNITYQGAFKTDLVTRPNDLKYFFDYIFPSGKIYDCSVDVLNPKVYSYKQEKLNRLYNNIIPNFILISTKMDAKERDKLIKECKNMGQPISNVDSVLFDKMAEGTSGYTAQEVARDLLYQYTNYNETISLSTIPIYYLDVNTRITVQDRKSNMIGDYIINTISLPLDAGGNMSISASKALERI